MGVQIKGGKRTPVKCYSKEYSSIKEWLRDFGISDTDTASYSYACSKIKAGNIPEDIIETILSKYDNSRKDADVQNEKATKPIENKPSHSSKNTKSTYDIKNNNPIYFNINTVDDVLKELKHMNNIKHINLIDFENVCSKTDVLKHHMNKENTINIFFYNACKFSNKFYGIIRYTNNINLQVLILDSYDQLVDHLIGYYLGALSAHFPEKSFTIISQDNAIANLINSLNKANINMAPITNTNIINQKDYNFSLAEYVVSNKYLASKDCINKDEFAKEFEGFYKTKMGRKMIINAISDLSKLRIVYEVNSGKGEKLYKFDINAAKRIVENRVS